MAATAWALYNAAKGKIGSGAINLATDIFRVQLHLSTSNAATLTLSLASELTNEVANANGYTTGGKTLSASSWAASAANFKFDATAVWWSANGGSITQVSFAVIKNSATGALLAFSKLSTTNFSVTSTNRLTVTPATAGVFVLS